MKKSFYNNNQNTLVKKKILNNNNIDNKNINKYNDPNNQKIKKELLNNKNQIIYKFSNNINNKPRQVKTAKCSPLSINNKIFKQITKIKNNQNINSIPTVIFNVKSNQIFEASNKKIQNPNESKSNNKSKSNDSNKNKKTNNKKSSNQCNLIKKSAKIENKLNNNIMVKTNTLTQKKTFKKNNVNLHKHKNNINQNQIKNNTSYNHNTNLYQFYYTNNQKSTMGTSLSLSSNKNNIVDLKYKNYINKNNINSFKTTTITTKNSVKSSKEKNNHNSNNSQKNNVFNKIKKINGINSKLISMGTKKKNNQQKTLAKNNGDINSLMKKLSNTNANKGNKKDNNKNAISNPKNLTLIGKNNNLNALSLSNFYSMNIFPKSNYFKTKLETKLQNNNKEVQRKNNKYFENLNNNNIFPITISNYKNNYININININNRKHLIKTSNKITKSKNNSKNKNNNNIIKYIDINKKKNLSTNNTKIINKINDIKRNFLNNNKSNTSNIKNNEIKIKELSYLDLKKANYPINLTSSLLQNESWGNSKECKKTEIQKVLPKLDKNDFCINDNYKKIINHNLTNNDNNNEIINSKRIITKEQKEINSNTITNKNEFSTISQKDYNYYNDESLKLIKSIQKFGLEQNFCNYPKTNLNYYKIGRSIGHGAFGKVNIALHVLSGHIVAIKSFNKIKKTFPINKIYYEIKLLKKLRNHKNIVKYFEHFENEKHFFIVMENISGGNLLNAINKMSKIPEPMAKIIFIQLIETIKYLHSIGIVHRDIKPDNILIELDNTIKLCDFGVSIEVKEGQLLRDSCGTPAFVAPEILKDSPYDPFMTDIWSSGVVLYAMITGFFPFRGVNQTELHRNILSGAFPKIKEASNELKDLLNKILEVNPSKRINIENILKHQWLNSDNSNSENISIFTRAEKIIYGKLKIDYRQANKENILENFTYHNMETDYEEENQNVKSISFIKTPYNSRRPRDDEEDLFYDDVNIENDIMKFLSKVGEMSRLYEVHNNFDFDQGFIIAKKEYYNKQKLMGSKNNSFENDEIKVEKKNKKENINNNNKCLEKNSKILNEDNNFDKNNKVKNTYLNNIKKIKINEKAIKFVENFGYHREFIIKSLQMNEINHAIATYYLGLSLLNE